MLTLRMKVPMTTTATMMTMEGMTTLTTIDVHNHDLHGARCDDDKR